MFCRSRISNQKNFHQCEKTDSAYFKGFLFINEIIDPASLIAERRLMPELDLCFDILKFLNQVLFNSSLVSGKWYKGKVLEKNPGISITKTYPSSYFM